MDFLFPVVLLALFLVQAFYFGSADSGRAMAVRKMIAGCGAIFFAIYGVAVPDARSESLIMTAMAVVIFYYLNRISDADKARDQVRR